MSQSSNWYVAQDNSGSGQQQLYETQHKQTEEVDSHSVTVSGDSRKTRRPLDGLSSSASASSQLPVPLSTSSHTVVGLPGQSNTDNDQGHVDFRPTSSMGRTEHGTEQVRGKT